MTEDKEWVDLWFVHATAWYLQLDLYIVDCASRDNQPFIPVSGNLDDADVTCNGPTITLGTKSNSHFQSLLPTDMFHLEFNQNQQNPNNSVQHDIEMKRTSEAHISKVNPTKIMEYVKEKPPDKMTKRQGNQIIH